MRNGEETLKGEEVTVPKQEEKELIDGGFALEITKIVKTLDNEIDDVPTENTLEDETEEITLAELYKKSDKDIEEIAKENNITLEGKNRKEKIEELFKKLSEVKM